MKAILGWLDDRTGYRRAIHDLLDEPVRGGASWAYVFGSVLTFILLLQAATGVLLAMYYSPSASDAWASVAYIQNEVTLGWFIRGLHSHGASAMVIVAGVHLLQVAVYGAYKRPREVNWLIGIVMLGLILAFALTGYLLPWDQKGYWATKVATGILGSTPILGGWLQRVVQGGNEYGNLTLTRFFAFHVFLLPAAIFLGVFLHLALFRKHGVTPRWGRNDAELDATVQPFWPDQLARDMAAILVTFAVLALWSWRGHGVELGAPADPASSYDARPEWYFLPLFELLKHFHGATEQIAALGAPLLVALILVALPFVDRGPSRAPSARIPYLAVILLGFLGAGALTAMSMAADAGDAALKRRLGAARAQAEHAQALARQGVPAAGGTAVYENEPFYQARHLFAERCAGCHAGQERKGPELGPGYGSRAWVRAFLQDPNGAAFFGPTKDLHKMKPVKEKGRELDALVELVYAQSGAADADAALAARGKEIFDGSSCTDCHTLEAGDQDEDDVNIGPNLAGRGTREWLARVIADAGHPALFGKLDEMPAFKDKLNEQQIQALADYVLSLRSGAP
jgi:ubiquinol-cytochrome c reductase cytochrome b subunit